VRSDHFKEFAQVSRKSITRLLATAAFTISLSASQIIPFDFAGTSIAVAAPQAKTAVGKLSAPQMMKKMEQSLLYIAKTLDQLPKNQKTKSAGFTKALVDAAKALGTLKKATEKKTRRPWRRPCPRLHRLFRSSAMPMPCLA